MAEVRVDKYLWAMRIYKTRSIAADACKNGRISMNGVQLKPSRTFKIGDCQTRAGIYSGLHVTATIGDPRISTNGRERWS